MDVIQDMKKVLGGERYLNLFLLKMYQARGEKSDSRDQHRCGLPKKGSHERIM
jgi:hypothetical protein